MTDSNESDERGITRRRVLQATGGTVGVTGLGSARVAATPGRRCPDATIRPNVVDYDDSLHEVCSNDDPTTESLQSGVRTALQETYPTVGSLIDAGYIPYFDFFTKGTVSHWIHPAAIGDDSTLDPGRPEAVLVDHTWWRPIGAMFVATDEGDRIDPPPTVYETDGGGRACRPWHAHVGFPGRYAWWKYRAVYEDGGRFPCRTPWMLHVWRYADEASVYAHDAPDDRGGAPAEPPGFETDADPNEQRLGPENLPAAALNEVATLWGRSD